MTGAALTAAADQRSAFIDEAVTRRRLGGTEQEWADWVVPRLRLLGEKDLCVVAGLALDALAGTAWLTGAEADLANTGEVDQEEEEDG